MSDPPGLSSSRNNGDRKGNAPIIVPIIIAVVSVIAVVAAISATAVTVGLIPLYLDDATSKIN